MSELKAFDIVVAEEGYCEGFVKYRRAVYDKSEADKVIADLDKSHKTEVRQLLILNRDQTNSANRLRDSMEQAIRHHKYKRCFKMARWCIQMMVFNSKYGTDKKWHLFKKWHKRWLALADKFKEGV